MSILNILPSTICSKTEMIHEFGVRDCDRIAEQMGNRLKHLCRAGCISSSLYARKDNLLECVKQNVKCYIF